MALTKIIRSTPTPNAFRECQLRVGFFYDNQSRVRLATGNAGWAVFYVPRFARPCCRGYGRVFMCWRRGLPGGGFQTHPHRQRKAHAIWLRANESKRLKMACRKDRSGTAGSTPAQHIISPPIAARVFAYTGGFYNPVECGNETRSEATLRILPREAHRLPRNWRVGQPPHRAGFHGIHDKRIVSRGVQRDGPTPVK